MSQQERKSGGISRRGFLIIASASAVAGLLEACGAKGKSKEVTPVKTKTPGSTPTVAPTPTVEPAPTVEPTKPPIKKLSEAQFTPTSSLNKVISLIDSGFRDHPDVAELHYLGGDTPQTRDSFDKVMEVCQFGDPGSPIYPAGIEIDRTGACSGLTGRLYAIYITKGYPEFYEAALEVTNYFLTELPHRKADFDKKLQIAIQDISPSIEK